MSTSKRVDKPAHGGARPGAGRPPTYGTGLEHTSVRLSSADKRYLRKLGNGNVSMGIHRVIALATGQEDDTGTE